MGSFNVSINQKFSAGFSFIKKVSENECVEFKRAKNNFDVDTLGKYFSALGNEANLKNKLYSWIIFGVDDKTHELTSTNYCIDNDFNKVKKQISDNTTDNISFIEIYTIVVNGKRVIMFQVPAASGTPINWKGFPYGRIGESLSPLSLNKIEQIKTTINYDWSRQVLEEATIDNLDKDAIKVAREQFKVKHKDDKLIDEKIEEKMDLVRDLISLGRNVREEAKIKVRQPISEAILDGKNKNIIGDLTELIKEELNVKEIKFVDDLSIYMNYEVKPNFKVCGPLLGSSIKSFQGYVKNFNYGDIKNLEEGNEVKINLDGKEITITYDMLDVRITSKEGFNSTHEGNNFIVLNTTLNKDLINEGIARELISKIQQLRKNKDFNIVDRINIYYSHNDEIEEAIEEYRDMIMKDTLAEQIDERNDLTEEFNINGIEVKLDVARR